MNDETVIERVVEWLQTLTGLIFIIGAESGDPPDGPHGMIQLIGSNHTRAHPQEVLFFDATPEQVMATPVLEHEWNFSVHVYGPDGGTRLRKVKAASHLAQLNEPLMPDLIIHSTSQIRNLPEYINNQWEDRTQMDLDVRGLDKQAFAVDVIEDGSIAIERVD